MGIFEWGSDGIPRAIVLQGDALPPPRSNATITSIYDFDVSVSGVVAAGVGILQEGNGLSAVLLFTPADLELGGCCFPDGTCQMLDAPACLDVGGAPQGEGSVCGGTQACCLSDALCTMADALCCVGGSAQGAGTQCTDSEACCLQGGTCQMLDPLCCDDLVGTPQGPGSRCSGSIVAFGDNGSEQCDVPPPNVDFIGVAGGFLHSLGVKDGFIVAWGDNSNGQCDVPPEPNGDCVAVAAGCYHSLCLKTDGSIVAWGDNGYGQCNVPAPNTDFVAIAAGCCHSLGLKSDRSIVAWGDNGSGQCDVPAPNADFIGVSGGLAHSVALRAEGSVVCWGSNDSGQCNVPDPNLGFVQISAGFLHTCGLKAEGSIECWGWSESGQCDVPPPNTDFVAVAAGFQHSLGLKRDGSIWCWGYNGEGQCDVPPPNVGFTAIAAGGMHSLGLTSGPEACCMADGSCEMHDPVCCDDLGGTPQGPGSTCCAYPIPATAVGDATIPTRVRYLSFSAPGGEVRANAVRVTLTAVYCARVDGTSTGVACDAHADCLGGSTCLFVDSVGKRWYVGAPRAVSEVAGKSDATPPTFWAASVGTDPYDADWSKYRACVGAPFAAVCIVDTDCQLCVGGTKNGIACSTTPAGCPGGTCNTAGTCTGAPKLVHVYGREIAPNCTYEVALAPQGCEALDCAYSTPLAVQTSKWGDVAGSNCCQAPNGIVDFVDISCLVDKFKNWPVCPMQKSRADVASGTACMVDQIIDFVDVPAIVDAFKGKPYNAACAP